jgi:hypothetical protein
VLFREQLTSGDSRSINVVIYDRVAWVTWLDDSGGAGSYAIKAAAFDATDSTPTGFGSPVTVASDGAALRYEVTTSADYIFFVYVQDTGDLPAEVVRVLRCDAAMAVQASNDTGEGNAAADLGINYNDDGDQLWVAYRHNPGAGTALRYAVFDSPSMTLAGGGPWSLYAYGSVVISPAFILTPIAIATVNATTCRFYDSFVDEVTFFGTTTQDQTLTAMISGDSSATVGSLTKLWHVYPVSKPLIYAGRVYCVMQTTLSDLQNTHILCDMRIDAEDFGYTVLPHVEALLNPGEAGERTAPSSTLAPIVPTGTTGEYMWSGQVVYDYQYGGSSHQVSRVESFRWSLSSRDRFLPATTRRSVAFAGALPSSYDGQTVHEQGFAWHPEVEVSVEGSGGSGNLQAGAKYHYLIVYEWFDARGQRHLSRPGPISSDPLNPGLTHTAVSANTSLQIAIRTLTMTNKWRQNAGPGGVDEGSPVRVLVYRTKGDSPGPFFLEAASSLIPKQNVTTAHTVEFVSGVPDSTIEQNEPLYIEDGSVPNDPPGSLLQMLPHNGRVFGITGSKLKFSKFTSGISGHAVEWSDSFVDEPVKGAALTGLASMDAALLIFTADSVRLLRGVGPDDGAAGAFAPLETLSSEVGCIDPRSICVFRGGVFFQSARGFEIIPRGFAAPVAIGERVADEVADWPVCFDARAYPKYSQLRVLVGDAENVTASRVLCYDYSQGERGAWTINRIDSSGRPPLSCAGTWGGVYVLGHATAANVYVEGPAFSDDGTYIPITLETGDIRMAGVAGFERMFRTYIVGEHRDDATYVLTVSAQYTLPSGENVAYSGSQSWTYMSPTTAAEIKPEYRNHIQRCTGVRLKIVDAGLTETVSGGPILNALQLEYAAGAAHRGMG